MFRDSRCYDMEMGDGNMMPNMGMKNMPNAGMNEMPNMGMPMAAPMECPPVYECPQERVCHREINHCVKHVQPVHTRIINHHICHHTVVPCFTCCEENVCTDVFDPCGRF